ncbi:MAG: ChbG/HpnK family deacetylase, partial [Ancalomicrobiaceae bacterium]|nr:ChbG/HpnK family deacetylase [Ancalomicrobiaceae bacterium]
MPELTILQLCADDFGLSEGIDRGILALIADGRLSATSCMVAGPALATHAGEL